jgi:hypothetical protein
MMKRTFWAAAFFRQPCKSALQVSLLNRLVMHADAPFTDSWLDATAYAFENLPDESPM